MKINVKIDTQSYQVEVEDIHARPVIAIIEGERYEVWPEEENKSKEIFDAPEISVPELQKVSTPATAGSQNSSAKTVVSPLPGVIVAVLVKPGDSVQHGQELCTLEAMKMKNAIRSSRDGKIASIEVNVGDQVNHGHVLMTYEA